MKTLEFEAIVNPDNTVSLPDEVAEQLRGAPSVKMVILMPDSSEDAAWNRLTTEQFLKGYTEGDAIYDELSSR